MQIHELNNYNGSLGDAYLVADNGSDTGKIKTTALTDPLNERIDNIISGPAPSASEIIDARLGADGKTYTSLGDAIRGQVSNLKENLNIVRFGELLPLPELQSGYFFASQSGTASERDITEYDDNGKKCVIDLSDYIGKVVKVKYKTIPVTTSSRSVVLGSVDKKWNISTSNFATEFEFSNGTIEEYECIPTNDYHTLYISFSNNGYDLSVYVDDFDFGFVDGVIDKTLKFHKGYIGVSNQSTSYYIDGSGEVVSYPYDGRCYSDLIRIPENAVIKYRAESNHNNVWGISYWDENGEFISGERNVEGGGADKIITTTTPKGAAFCRLSLKEYQYYSNVRKLTPYLHYDEYILTKPTICYVQSTGSDSNDGLIRSKPFETIQHAIDEGFKRIIVKEGVYSPFAILSKADISIEIDRYYDAFDYVTHRDNPKIIIDGDNTSEIGVTVSNCNNCNFESISVINCTKAGWHISRGNSLKFVDCDATDIARTGTLVGGGFVMTYLNADFYNCFCKNIGRYDTAPAADHNDGFNIHGTGTTNFYNCWAINCQDDGISHHDACYGSIVGGEWSHCGKGGIASPAHGACIDISNAYCHDNGYGIYAYNDYAELLRRPFNITNCVCKNNTSKDIGVGNASANVWNCIYDTIEHTGAGQNVIL